MSRQSDAGQNRNKKAALESFGNFADVKYLGNTIKNQNYVLEEIESR
jgi:hypothetical protein